MRALLSAGTKTTLGYANILQPGICVTPTLIMCLLQRLFSDTDSIAAATITFDLLQNAATKRSVKKSGKTGMDLESPNGCCCEETHQNKMFLIVAAKVQPQWLSSIASNVVFGWHSRLTRDADVETYPSLRLLVSLRSSLCSAL